MQRWLVMLGLAACDAGAKAPIAAQPPPAAPGDARSAVAPLDAFDEDVYIPFPKETLGTIEGMVTDAKTHEPVWGGSINVAMPSGNWAPSDNSGKDGRFHIRIPEGSYKLTFEYPDTKNQVRDLVVKRGETTTLDF